MSRHDEIDLDSIRTMPVSKRPTKVRVEQFAPAPDPAQPISSFDQFLPDLLAGAQLRDLIQAWVLARTSGRPAVAMLGGHVIKTGVQRPLLSLMDAGAFSAIAVNGAAAIHDFEIALFGTTSEPVEETLVGGQFGMVEETPVLMNQAVQDGVAKGLGMGEALGEFLLEADAPHADSRSWRRRRREGSRSRSTWLSGPTPSINIRPSTAPPPARPLIATSASSPRRSGSWKTAWC